MVNTLEDQAAATPNAVEFTTTIGPDRTIQLPEGLAAGLPTDCRLRVSVTWEKGPVVYADWTDEEWCLANRESLKRAELEDPITEDYSDLLQR